MGGRRVLFEDKERVGKNRQAERYRTFKGGEGTSKKPPKIKIKHERTSTAKDSLSDVLEEGKTKYYKKKWAGKKKGECCTKGAYRRLGSE